MAKQYREYEKRTAAAGEASNRKRRSSRSLSRERSGNKQGGRVVASSSAWAALSGHYLSPDLVLVAPRCNYA